MATQIDIYDNALWIISRGTVDFGSDSLGVLLLNNGYTFSNSHNVVSDVTSFEISGGNYARKDLMNAELSLANNIVTFDADNVVWTNLNASGVVRYAIVYRMADEYGADDESQVLFYLDLGVNYTPDGTTFSIQWNASGIFTLAKK